MVEINVYHSHIYIKKRDMHTLYIVFLQSCATASDERCAFKTIISGETALLKNKLFKTWTEIPGVYFSTFSFRKVGLMLHTFNRSLVNSDAILKGSNIDFENILGSNNKFISYATEEHFCWFSAVTAHQGDFQKVSDINLNCHDWHCIFFLTLKGMHVKQHHRISFERCRWC